MAIVGCSGDSAGQLTPKNIRSWMLPADGPRITKPRAVHVGPEQNIYVLDDNGRVVVFDGDAKVVKQWRMPESAIGNPEGICFLQDGRIVVADTHYDRLVYFDQSGNVLKYQGEHGRDPGQFAYPVAVTQDDHGFIYVAEYGDKQRVQKFTVEGEFVVEFGDGGTEPGHFQRPSGLVWHEGLVYVVDAFNNRMQVFKDDGAFVGMPGDKDYELQYPYDVTKAPDGTLYVVEYKAGRVTHLSRDGRMLGHVGKTGRGTGELNTPWGIAFRGTSSVIVADTGNSRIVEIEL